MKKRIRSLVFTFAAAVLLALLPQSNVLTVRAEGPETYSVAFIGDPAYNEWRYQPGSVFDAPKGHGPLSELLGKLKDGDHVVVYQVDDPKKELRLGSAKLGSLTVHQGTTAIVYTGGVKDCYVLAGSYISINGDVTTAYIYDAPSTAANTTACTFNNNVLDMYLYLSRDPASAISCNGTVGYFHASYADNGDYFAAFYDIKAGQVIYQDGHFNVPDWAYGSGPSEEYLKAKAAAESKPAPASPAEKPADKNTSDEYDKVPKTGDSSPVLWLFLASAACFGGSCLLRKKQCSK